MSIREGNYVLGLRLGIASLGWAALAFDGDDKPASILAMGVRKFPVGAMGDVASGRDESPNARRREARSTRVRLARRVERLRGVWTLLQSAGLLPAGRFKDRHAAFEAMGLNPYALRAKALDAPLAPHELGRALYHLSQRRGFQSNRRQAPKDNEELGIVKQGVADLRQAMTDTKSRTLGEYLARLDRTTPCRRRWLGRDMLREEFAAIVKAQTSSHPNVSEKFWTTLARTIFFQRPLKSHTHKIGKCELEPSRRRAQLARLDVQEFRVLCRINDLRLVDDVGAEPIALSAEQRQTLLELLRSGDASFAAVRKALGVPKTVRFNAERIDPDKLIGFRTEARIRKAIGDDAWNALSVDQRTALVGDLLNIDEDAGLLRRLLGTWKLPRASADTLLATTLEPAYAMLSCKAIAKVLPALREGEAYATARARLDPKADHHEEKARLPIVQTLYPHLANPLVGRALGELRVIVNALVAKHGRPKAVRVSLMRELRLGRKTREQVAMKMRARNRQRAQAAARVLQDLGVQEPTRWMIDKVLLAEECGWICPFTGKTISMRSLVGGDPKFEVVHLVPFHQSLDDSFENKTLCHVSAVDGSRTVEAKAVRQIGPAVIGRFEKLVGPFAKEKLRRVKLTREEIIAEFSDEIVAGRFVDTCYASKLAADMLSQLYPPSRAAVTTVKGSAMGYLKEACGLHRLDLPDGSYRRAAIDAAAVALADPHVNRRLSAAAIAAMPGRRRLHPETVLPWARFAGDVGNTVERIVISARVRKKVSGALHEETFYRQHRDDGWKSFYSVRKHLWQLSPTDVPAIMGARVRAVVAEKLLELKQPDPRKAFVHRENLPIFRDVPVRAVRINRLGEMFAIGRGPHVRHVATERNHHAAVFMRPGRGGRMMADRVIVSQFEAQRRLAQREAVIAWPEGSEPCAAFPTLSVLEIIEMMPHASAAATSARRDYMTVRCVSRDPPIVLTSADDARTLAEINADKARLRMSVEQLRLRGARKVVVTPLGEVRSDNS